MLVPSDHGSPIPAQSAPSLAIVLSRSIRRGKIPGVVVAIAHSDSSGVTSDFGRQDFPQHLERRPLSPSFSDLRFMLRHQALSANNGVDKFSDGSTIPSGAGPAPDRRTASAAPEYRPTWRPRVPCHSWECGTGVCRRAIPNAIPVRKRFRFEHSLPSNWSTKPSLSTCGVEEIRTACGTRARSVALH